MSLPIATFAQPRIPQYDFCTPIAAGKESVACVWRKVFSPSQVLAATRPDAKQANSSSLLSQRDVLHLLLVIVFSRILGIPSAGMFIQPGIVSFPVFAAQQPYSQAQWHQARKLNCFFQSLAYVGPPAAFSHRDRAQVSVFWGWCQSRFGEFRKSTSWKCSSRWFKAEQEIKDLCSLLPRNLLVSCMNRKRKRYNKECQWDPVSAQLRVFLKS